MVLPSVSVVILKFWVLVIFFFNKVKKIKIKVNGKIITIVDKLTLAELTDDLKIPLKKVAIELNKEIVNKKRINKIKLDDKDIIEIVHFIGGGWPFDW